MTNKASRRYWDDLNRRHGLRAARKSDRIRKWLEAHVETCADGSRSCIEIGCCPGRFLAVFGELGYELHGIDLTAEVERLPGWLAQRGCRTGRFWRQDFLDFDPQRSFDVVASFGFVEHFTNWREVLERHARLVGEGGLLVVEAPNFRGAFQSWLHRRFDRDNYDRHHIPAMDIAQWVAALEPLGFEILYQGCFGGFHFWTEAQPRPLSQRLALAGLKLVRRPLGWVLPRHCRAYAPFCGVVARRRSRA